MLSARNREGMLTLLYVFCALSLTRVSCAGDLQQRKVGRARDPLLSAPGHSNADELDVKARADEFSTPKDREMARHNVILSYKNEFGLEMTPKEVRGCHSSPLWW